VQDITATELQSLLEVSLPGASREARGSATYASSGTTLTVTSSCPARAVSDLSYTATDSDLTLFYMFSPDTVFYAIRLVRG
jgi:hypothetical protein